MLNIIKIERGPKFTAKLSGLDRLSAKATKLPISVYTVKFERLARKVAAQNRSSRQKVKREG